LPITFNHNPEIRDIREEHHHEKDQHVNRCSFPRSHGSIGHGQELGRFQWRDRRYYHWNALVRYLWPGNIREMQNIIVWAEIFSRGPVLDIPWANLKPRIPDGGEMNGFGTLDEVERRHMLSVLEQTNWVFGGPNGAAVRLGIKRPTLQFRMQKLGITRPQRSTSARTPAQST
jgi:hypothetical protein